jgi:LexA DNA binding domain
MTEQEDVDINKIASRVSGKCISHLTVPENGQLTIHFEDGAALFIQRDPGGLAIDFASGRSSECALAVQPTSRQEDYLEFIKKYMTRFGISPAESDIQRHFLVSAPSVNQMMQALERHGFIMRQRGVARSIRLVEATNCAVCGGSHHLKSASHESITRASTRPPQKRGG